MELGSLLSRLSCDIPQRKARPLHALCLHFRLGAAPGKMAEDPESVLQLPPSAVAAGGEGLGELSPETATPEPPSAAVSPGTEEPAGDTKKKSNFQGSF